MHIDLAGEGARGRVGVEDDSAGGVAAVVYLQVNNNILNFYKFFFIESVPYVLSSVCFMVVVGRMVGQSVCRVFFSSKNSHYRL